MEKLKKTRVKHITLPTDCRLIFVSDIHGDRKLLMEGLEKVNFNDKDHLFVIGDMIEKGDEGMNLDMIRYMMEFSKKPNVHLLAGNCDEVFRFILPPIEEKEKFFYYTITKRKSILNDMANEMNYVINENMDVNDFLYQVHERYYDILNFLDNLDDVVIINDQFVLVHAGIDDINNIPELAQKVLKYDKFYEYSKPQPKLMIVGHYPTRNYRHDIACSNPIFDFRKKIISIDGGNFVVKGGQINIVSLESIISRSFNFTYVDHYEKYIMKRDVKYEAPSVRTNITYGQNVVEILETDLDFYYVNHLNSNTKMWINKDDVYYDPHTGKYFCYDGCNTFISVNKGQEISVIKRTMPYSLIKKDGIIGLIDTKYIEDEI